MCQIIETQFTTQCGGRTKFS